MRKCAKSLFGGLSCRQIVVRRIVIRRIVIRRIVVRRIVARVLMIRRIVVRRIVGDLPKYLPGLYSSYAFQQLPDRPENFPRPSLPDCSWVCQSPGNEEMLYKNKFR